MIKTGDVAPLFSLPDQDGNIILLEKLIGQKIIVLFFYPKDETRGCTAEACSFRDHYEEFLDLGCEVIGISGDNETSHRSFASNHQLPYKLLSDKDNAVRKLYGAKGPLFGLIPGRVTYVIDKQGKVVHVFNSMMQFDQHVKEALTVIKGLQ